jgi:hypothetical protein
VATAGDAVVAGEELGNVARNQLAVRRGVDHLADAKAVQDAQAVQTRLGQQQQRLVDLADLEAHDEDGELAAEAARQQRVERDALQGVQLCVGRGPGRVASQKSLAPERAALDCPDWLPVYSAERKMQKRVGGLSLKLSIVDKMVFRSTSCRPRSANPMPAVKPAEQTHPDTNEGQQLSWICEKQSETSKTDTVEQTVHAAETSRHAHLRSRVLLLRLLTGW